MARGKSRSDSIAHVVKNVKELAATGTKEIVLTGINLGDFSPPTSQRGDSEKVPKEEKENFYSLIKKLEEVEGILRYRISSIEPNLLSNEIIDFVANSDKFMPHFHIPLQSGSNTVLGLMRRRYRKELYAERVKLIKTLMPHCAVGADVIVGFPGETEDHFKETFDFLHTLDVSYLHVFTYSERDNTHALTLKPVVPMRIRHERNKTLRNLSYMKMQYFTEQHAGQTRKVLFEKHGKGTHVGCDTDTGIRIIVAFTEELKQQSNEIRKTHHRKTVNLRPGRLGRARATFLLV
jgi:threonylcarbamoyladenosine tRNA methylthiotransferase MtaB